jgi:molybdenum cofactor biosynthesis enzyme MoaA
MNTTVHNYAGKLRGPAILPGVSRTMKIDESRRPTSLREAFAARYEHIGAPISVNLDLTVACNYRCPHCIDGPILNTGHRYTLDQVLQSLTVLRLAGLRSVILIGGGEPTMHPHFREAVLTIKALGLQCAIVSNGGNIGRLLAVAPYLRRPDWIRLSLDAGSNATFTTMHLPQKVNLDLDAICCGVRAVKDCNKDVSVGFSFIVAWEGASVRGVPIQDNVDEMAQAADLAKRSGFDYIAFKPILDRDEKGGEVVNLGDADRRCAAMEAVSARIAAQLDKAKQFEDQHFRVIVSLNLLGLGCAGDFTRMRIQPRMCHMHFFRQVLTPMGVFGCPVYRGNPKDRIGPLTAYHCVEAFLSARRRAVELWRNFNASQECKNVTCIYNSTNWWLESLRDGAEAVTAEDAPADLFI